MVFNKYNIGEMAGEITNSHIATTTTTTTTTSTTSSPLKTTLKNNNNSVSDFYNGKTVFITGGTGFMGKVLLEKLLRSCNGVEKIYLLIRTKKQQNAHERLKQLLNSPLFDEIRAKRPLDLLKVLPIEGDITEPELAISTTNQLILSHNVNIVFHSAATVKFDEKLKLSVTINMLGTQRLIQLCKRMTNLEALVHVSTAYCNCDRDIVEEKIYKPPLGPNEILSLVTNLNEHTLNDITKYIIGKRPNTYTFTKALAEYWLEQNSNDLPLIIVRPTIVLSCIKQPIIGWVDNWNGPTGIIAAAGKGLFRTMLCHPNKVADLIPVDMVINLMICSAWNIANNKKYSSNNINNNKIEIYNFCSGLRKPITWKQFIELSFKYMRIYPFNNITWYPNGSVTTSYYLNLIQQYLLHWLPAYIIDSLIWLIGKKPVMVRIQDKLERAATCLEYFTTKEWKFLDNNVKELNLKLNDKDREEFNFDVRKINWDEYIKNYILGIREFIFKENRNSIPQARKQIFYLYCYYKLIQLISIFFTWNFIISRSKKLKLLWLNAIHLIYSFLKMLPFH